MSFNSSLDGLLHCLSLHTGVKPCPLGQTLAVSASILWETSPLHTSILHSVSVLLDQGLDMPPKPDKQEPLLREWVSWVTEQELFEADSHRHWHQQEAVLWFLHLHPHLLEVTSFWLLSTLSATSPPSIRFFSAWVSQSELLLTVTKGPLLIHILKMEGGAYSILASPSQL